MAISRSESDDAQTAKPADRQAELADVQPPTRTEVTARDTIHETVGQTSHVPDLDPDLQRLISAWPGLPGEARFAIMAIARATVSHPGA